MTPDGVAAVLSQTFHRDITQPTATGLNDLEGLHNNVHAWIAGNMNTDGSLNIKASSNLFENKNKDYIKR
jgi:hypothetical protein